jgi:hypothetical protein
MCAVSKCSAEFQSVTIPRVLVTQRQLFTLINYSRYCWLAAAATAEKEKLRNRIRPCIHINIAIIVIHHQASSREFKRPLLISLFTLLLLQPPRIDIKYEFHSRCLIAKTIKIEACGMREIKNTKKKL